MCGQYLDELSLTYPLCRSSYINHMKNKIHPTDVEKVLKQDDFIVAKTDSTGKITYCNRTFIHLSGYSERELLGSQHNIVRHPDMPRAVFHLLWEKLKEGGEFFCYINNLCMYGGFYWVFANLTPTFDPGGKLVGYYSVRRHPSLDALNVIKPLYQEMLLAENKAATRGAIQAARVVLNNRLREYGIDYEHFILQI